jgi:hypothetical protein
VPVNELRASHTGGPGAWVGLIKHGKEVVWRCPHKHPNRNEETTHNTAATRCASIVLDAVNDPSKTRRSIEAMQRGYPTVAGVDAATVFARWRSSIRRYEWALEQAATITGGTP